MYPRIIKEGLIKMAEYDWIYYDTVDVGTSANTDKEFFAHSEASDGIHITNLGTANELPTNEEFEVQEIHVIATPDLAVSDVYKLFEEAILELKINNNRKLIIPAILAGSYGHQYLCLEDAADAAAAGTATPTGGPYKLDTPIIIKGGVKFSVVFRTGTTAATSGDSIIVCLRGKLKRT